MYAYKILVEKRGRKRSLGRCRWEGNIRMEQWDGKEWTG
jgi:hypothetical protein